MKFTLRDAIALGFKIGVGMVVGKYTIAALEGLVEGLPIALQQLREDADAEADDEE